MQRLLVQPSEVELKLRLEFGFPNDRKAGLGFPRITRLRENEERKLDLTQAANQGVAHFAR